MNTVRVNAYAKLNLTLDLVGRRENYHLLDSLVTTVDLPDRIVAKKRKDGLIRIQMHGMGSEAIPPEQNNAFRAGEAFVSAFGTCGADIEIYKNIPIGGGLGGSSADAAGVLNALSMLYEVRDEKEIKAIADRLGSDTGYLLSGGFARLRGRGEEVEPLGDPPPLFFLVLCPKEGVSTAECYKISDTYPKNQTFTPRALELLRSGNIEWAAKLFHNDLYPAAEKLNPEVGEALRSLKELSPWGASMTGSGSAVFALFETEELCLWAKSRVRGGMRGIVLRACSPQKEGDLFPSGDHF